MIDKNTEQAHAEDAKRPVDVLVSHCHKCGDKLTGHEDEGKALCRWCVTGWSAAQSDANMVYDEKGQLVYG